MAKSFFEPNQSGQDQGGIGDVVLEDLNDVSPSAVDGDEDFRAELCGERELAPHDRADMILMKRDDPPGNGEPAVIDLLLLVEDDLDFPAGSFKPLEEAEDALGGFSLGAEFLSRNLSQVLKLFKISTNELDHFLMDVFSGLGFRFGDFGESHEEFASDSGISAG